MDRSSFENDNWVLMAENHAKHFIEGVQMQYAEPAMGNWVIQGYAQYNLMEHFKTGSPFELYVAVNLHRYLKLVKDKENASS